MPTPNLEKRLKDSKPDVPINKQFIAQLRNDIQDAASAAPNVNKKTFINYFSTTMNKILASALVVMMALSAGGFWYIQNRTDKPLFQSPAVKEANQVLSGKYAVSESKEESFGDLSKVSVVNVEKSAVYKGSGANDRNTSSSPTPTMSAFGMGEAPNSDSKMIAPGEPYPMPEQYVFQYDGKDLPNVAANQSVYKRVLPEQQTSLTSRIVSLLSFGLIDFNKFQNLNLQSLSFGEDREYGYQVNVDLVAGSVNMYQNYEKWPQPIYDQNNGYKPLTVNDIPADNDVFKVTNAFLEEYGISREAYDNPQVIDNNWRIMYERLPVAERTNFYFPEQVQVIYPLKLDGKIVYDESGNPSGLGVYYDIRSKRVMNMYELTTKQFAKSSYKGMTDTQKILEAAEKGGFRNYSYNDTSGKFTTATLKLDTPSIQMVRMWVYDYNNPKGNSGTELYVPAMVFPVKDWEKSGYWRRAVYVPLVKEIFESEPAPTDQPIPVDLPMGTMSGAAGAETTPATLPKTQNR